MLKTIWPKHVKKKVCIKNLFRIDFSFRLANLALQIWPRSIYFRRWPKYVIANLAPMYIFSAVAQVCDCESGLEVYIFGGGPSM